jgi:non-canonical purine NTP pyrophosphatase (RdgB/HAM1 family)
MKLLIATSNVGKFGYIKYMLEEVDGVEILGLNEVGLDHHHPEETGETYEENAFLKAKYFFDLCGFPTVGEDSGIIVEAIKDELGLHTRRWGAGKDASDEQWLDCFMERMKDETDRRAKFVSTVVYYEGYRDSSLGAKYGDTSTDSVQAPAQQKYYDGLREELGTANHSTFSETEPNYKLFFGDIHGWITEEVEAPIKDGLPLSSVFRPAKSCELHVGEFQPCSVCDPSLVAGHALQECTAGRAHDQLLSDDMIYHDRVFSAMTDEEKEKESHRGRAMEGLRQWLKAKKASVF